LLTLANISFPGSVNFIGELLVLIGIFIKNFLLGITIIFLMILSTCYSLWLYNKLFSGLLIKNIFMIKTILTGFLFNQIIINRLFLVNYSDLNLREFFSLNYLMIPVILFGLNPSFLIQFFEIDFISLLVF